MNMTPQLTHWQSLPPPKVHFNLVQHFVPQAVYDELQAMPEASPFPPDDWVIPTTDIVRRVSQHYTLPFTPYDYQCATINALGDQTTAGLWHEVGAGKTLSGTVMALNHRIDHPGTVIVLMPPILLGQWQRFLRSIPELDKVTIYRGTPSQRQAIDLDVDFLLVSMDIFKNDFQRLYDFYLDKNVTLIVDEAVSVKNPATMNHKCVWAFHNQNLTNYNISQRRKTEAKVKRQGRTTGQAQKAQDIIDLKRKMMEIFNG